MRGGAPAGALTSARDRGRSRAGDAATPAPRPGGRRRSWRHWNRAIHRDLGYLAVGLTLVYAVSGIAVNHRHDWNPDYRVTRQERVLASLPAAEPGEDAFALAVLRALGVAAAYRGTFRPEEGRVDIFVDGGSVSVDLERRSARVEVVTPRPVLPALNRLHLNLPRRLWTWVADLYAGALIVLAVSGAVLLKGRQGIGGRGAWLVGAGALIPLVFLLLYG